MNVRKGRTYTGLFEEKRNVRGLFFLEEIKTQKFGESLKYLPLLCVYENET